MFTLGLIAIWLLVGCAVGLYMTRRGHAPYLWLFLVPFGPLALLFAVGSRDDETRASPTVTQIGSVSGQGSLHLLAGVDGSEAARQAAAGAVRLLHDLVARVSLVAVLDYESPETHPLRDEVAEADSWLVTAEQAIEPDVGAPPARVVLFGDPATELLRWAREEEADVIAVAARSHGLGRHLLAGSVTRRVVQASSCPVVVLPTGASDDGPASDRSRDIKERNTS
jgi:nucleotide-binding universal stress UspA family protein